MENYSQRFLVVLEGPNEGHSYPLQDMVCTLGRTTDNTIVIDSTRISRRHTQIRLLPQGAIIEDMGSMNGTWVNQRRLTGPHQLMPGDIITLADYISFRYEVEDAMQTERLATIDAATQVMEDDLQYTPPPPPPPNYAAPYRAYTEADNAPQQPFLQSGSASQSPGAPAASTPQSAITAPPAKRSKSVYIIIALLAVLICICVGIAVYLWFAPVSFWEQVFELFNIPIP